MARIRTHFECQQGGYQAPRWMGRCPECGNWGSLVEERPTAGGGRGAGVRGPSASPVPVTEVEGPALAPIPTGFPEVDRTLGGGGGPGPGGPIGGGPLGAGDRGRGAPRSPGSPPASQRWTERWAGEWSPARWSLSVVTPVSASRRYCSRSRHASPARAARSSMFRGRSNVDLPASV